MTFRRVAVLMGGSGEAREASVRAGEAVAVSLVRQGHEVHPVLAGPGLEATLRGLGVDAVFLAVEGAMGEAGRIQGLLEVMGLPYTGSGVLASALATDKPMAKKVLRYHNLPTPLGYCVGRDAVDRALQDHGDMGFPVVVRAAGTVSGCESRLVRQPEDLQAAIEQMCQVSDRILVERFVRGRQIAVAIAADKVLGSCEVNSTSDSAGLRAEGGGSRMYMPPRLTTTRTANVEALALAAHRALGCRGLTRVDLVASESENDFILGVDTVPSLSPTGLLPKIARVAGVGFDELVASLLSQASTDAPRRREVESMPELPLVGRRLATA